MTRRVAFVGPLPPPVHGFSNICACVLDLLKSKWSIEVFDRAPRQTNVIFEGIAQFADVFRYIGWCCRGRNVSLYIALSGGYGQFIDWPYVIAARLFRSRIVIHHHSFSYLNSPTCFNKVFFASVRKNTHIVLSRGMSVALSNTYKVESDCIRIVSNAAFYEPGRPRAEATSRPHTPIRLGFLSNVTFEKGFVEFFEVLAELRRRGVPYQALIAGPVKSDASARFSQLLSASEDVTYLGAIYGDAKDQFYARLDCFLFPTQYANEAEPLVIHEALRSGIQVIACDRGAIAEMLDNGAGLVFTRDEFVNGAAAHIEQLSGHPSELTVAQRLSQEQFQRMRRVAQAEMSGILNEIIGIDA